jgi:hypothetical protein
MQNTDQALRVAAIWRAYYFWNGKLILKSKIINDNLNLGKSHIFVKANLFALEWCFTWSRRLVERICLPLGTYFSGQGVARQKTMFLYQF